MSSQCSGIVGPVGRWSFLVVEQRDPTGTMCPRRSGTASFHFHFAEKRLLMVEQFL